ncbi:MAG TPA: ferrous iron transport protein B [Candidatus Aveggerthella excrementigallinarum]|nr:ferrous iron transport protein B [Candidatus Aveggerthella excrementigallinarum]
MGAHEGAPSASEPGAEHLTVAFIGNPNCGKTTLFNALTGANLKVANWPGVTVEKVEGSFDYEDGHMHHIHLVDLPGAYSLTSYTMEERVSREFILSGEADVVVDVVDASSLERNLYLTLQLLELGRPVVVALNMMDVVEKRGMEIDVSRLHEMLGAPVVRTAARARRGIKPLVHAAVHHWDSDVPETFLHDHDEGDMPEKHARYAMVYSPEMEARIDAVQAALVERYPDIVNPRWHAIKLLEGDETVAQRHPVDLPDVLDRSYESEIINQKYAFIEEIVREVVVNRDERAELTDRVDAVVTGKWTGLPVFLLVMAAVFAFTFLVGDWLKGYFELGIEWFSEAVASGFGALGVHELLTALVVDGIIAGVGAIITFLPNIAALFLALAVLEDSGYMARVAYVMDGIMGRIGLSGRAFLPLILGFGCSVPAVMATRTLEEPRDRRKAMLVTPFMSCSARLPIYILFSGIFFPDCAMVVAYSLYVVGLVVALVALWVMHLAERRRGLRHADLLIELPDYKMPSARTVAIYVKEKVWDYVQRAGTVIFVASVVLWLLLNFGPGGYTEDMGASFAALIGQACVPFFAPIGLGFWQISTALIAGISAKEVVVSSTAILFGVGGATTDAGMAAIADALGAVGFGPLNAYCLMVFCLLYVPCVGTIATIKKESGSWKWTAFSVAFQVAVAWLVAFAVYQIGSLVLA